MPQRHSYVRDCMVIGVCGLITAIIVVDWALLRASASSAYLEERKGFTVRSCKRQYINKTVLSNSRTTENKTKQLPYGSWKKISILITKKRRDPEEKIVKLQKEVQHLNKIVREGIDNLKKFTIIFLIALVISSFQGLMMKRLFDKTSNESGLKKFKDENVQTHMQPYENLIDSGISHSDELEESENELQYDSTDDEDESSILTPAQKLKLCRWFADQDWVGAWQFCPEFLEVHIDSTIQRKDASDQLSYAFEELKLPQLQDHLKLVQFDDVNFKFTCLNLRPGTSIQGNSEDRNEQIKVCIGAYVEVTDKGTHALSAGHGTIQEGWQLEFEDSGESKVLGHCVSTCFKVFPKTCDVILVKLVGDFIEGQNIVTLGEGREVHLTMHSGSTKQLCDKQCLKYEENPNSPKGTVESLDFYFKDKQLNGRMQFSNCISVSNQAGPEIPFSTDGDSGKLVVIEPEADCLEKAIVLGIICGLFDETIDGKHFYRTCVTPIWRALRRLQQESYCRGKRITLK